LSTGSNDTKAPLSTYHPITGQAAGAFHLHVELDYSEFLHAVKIT